MAACDQRVDGIACEHNKIEGMTFSHESRSIDTANRAEMNVDTALLAVERADVSEEQAGRHRRDSGKSHVGTNRGSKVFHGPILAIGICVA